MSDSPEKPYSPGVAAIFEVVARLRAPGGCPWDREQTHESLRPYLLEETYELLEAIDSGDDAKIKEELGDLLLQVAMHAEIAAEQRRFDAAQVSESVAAKMVARHPHVFGDAQVADADEVLRNWEHAQGCGQTVSEALRRDGGIAAARWGGLPRSRPRVDRQALGGDALRLVCYSRLRSAHSSHHTIQHEKQQGPRCSGQRPHRRSFHAPCGDVGGVPRRRFVGRLRLRPGGVPEPQAKLAGGRHPASERRACRTEPGVSQGRAGDLVGLCHRGGSPPQRVRETERTHIPHHHAPEPVADPARHRIADPFSLIEASWEACPHGGIIRSRSGAAAARRAHNPKVVGSNPTSATKFRIQKGHPPRVPFSFLAVLRTVCARQGSGLRSDQVRGHARYRHANCSMTPQPKRPITGVSLHHSHDSSWPATADWLDLRNHLVKTHGVLPDDVDYLESYVDGTTGRRRHAEDRHRALHLAPQPSSSA